MVKTQMIWSNNSCFKLEMLWTGNLVLFRVSDNVPLWKTNTSGTQAYKATMLINGDLTLTNKNSTQTYWSSNTAGGNFTNILWADFFCTVDKWWAFSVLKCRFNFSGVRKLAHKLLIKCLWNWPWTGTIGAYLLLQDDGNLVIKNTSGSIVWSSNTNSNCTGINLLIVNPIGLNSKLFLLDCKNYNSYFKKAKNMIWDQFICGLGGLWSPWHDQNWITLNYFC